MIAPVCGKYNKKTVNSYSSKWEYISSVKVLYVVAERFFEKIYFSAILDTKYPKIQIIWNFVVEK